MPEDTVRPRWVPLLAIFLIGFGVWANNLNNDLFWDDDDWIVKNTRVHEITWDNIEFLISRDVVAGIGQRSNFYRPFLMLTFMANYAVAEVSPWIYHLTSNLLHIGAALLLFLLADRFVGRLAGWIAALFFLLLLGAICLVLWSGGHWTGNTTAARRAWGTAAALLCAVLAIGSRETGILLPAYLLLVLVTFPYRDRLRSHWKSLVLDILPFVLLSGIYAVLRLTVLNFADSLNFEGHVPEYAGSLAVRLMTFGDALLEYYKLIVLPIGLHMDHSIDPAVSLSGSTIVSALFLLAWIGWIVYDLNRSRLALLVVGWFFTNLALTTGIFPVNAYMHEHWLYFSLAGIGFGLGAGVAALARDRAGLQKALVGAFTVLCILYAGQTIRRNQVWGDPVRFYEEILWYANYYEGVELTEPEDPTRLPNYRTLNLRAANNLAMEYTDSGRVKRAEAMYLLLISAMNTNQSFTPEPCHNLANLYVDQGRLEEALIQYQNAVTADPGFSPSYVPIIALLIHRGEFDNANRMRATLVRNGYDPEDLSASINRELEEIRDGLRIAG
jgi:tetratricopeptide (TPR) repeat protein